MLFRSFSVPFAMFSLRIMKFSSGLLQTGVRHFWLIVMMLVIARSARAQKNDPPSGQFGAGIYAVSNYLPSGFEFTYALDSTMQIGSEFSLTISNSVGSYLISPFARYLFFPWIVSPFVQGGLQMYSPSTGTQFGIFLGGGAAFCINHQLNIHGDVDLLNWFLSPSALRWFVLRIGGDWFF